MPGKRYTKYSYEYEAEIGSYPVNINIFSEKNTTGDINIQVIIIIALDVLR